MKTVEYRVKIEFPWSLHKSGEIISVYESNGMAYLVGEPDYGNGEGQSCSGDFDVRDYPDIYELVK